MTHERARRLGYDVDGFCTQCGSAPDTPFHRVYGCAHSENAVRTAVPDWFWQEAQRAAAGDKVFWTSAIFPHPADVIPAPREDLHMAVDVVHEREVADDVARAAATADGLDIAKREDGRSPHQRAHLGGTSMLTAPASHPKSVTSAVRDVPLSKSMRRGPW